MADFVAILKTALDRHGDETPEKRTRIYGSVRAMLAKKLAERSPPLATEAITTQKRALEDAIVSVERDYAKSVPETDPLAELENIFSSIDRNKNQSSHVRQPLSTPQPPRPEPARPQSARPEPVRPEPARREPARPETVRPAAPYAAKPTPPAARVEPSWQRSSTAPSFPDRAAPDRDDATLPGMDEGEPDEKADIFANDERPAADTFERLRPARRKRSYGGLIAAVVALAVIGGAYGIWLNKGAFGKMFGSGDSKVVKTEPLKAAPANPAANAAASPTAPATGTTDAAGATKFTQRLTPQGSETDPGPAGGQSGIGEGESVAALTTPPPAHPTITPPAGDAQAAATPAANAPAAAATPPAPGAAPATPPANGTAPAAPAAVATPAAPAGATPAPAGTTPTPAAAEPTVAVGQKAIFYEERTSTSQGSAEPGSIVWSLVQESPGGDLPPEPAIRAEATIPGKDIQLRMTIRRNTDRTLPASHIIEMIFLTPEGFEGGGVDNILRVAMKSSEQDAGSPLIGIPAKIADGFFLVALNDTKADEDANMTLLRGQDWIDVPVVYKTGRRALLTMEKGIPGEKVFDEAIKAWQAKTAG
ncbi:hypothetical protein LGH82_22205 [Mesorhizobium sp. PAMC28654]|uniref:hypothetical protein n=1 Tax=Mesorhizobium sp. PAMC28654 TaxID=2880934 RepID=UPI001D0A3A13|nr:hypothetical protein [Mesorhizobium sp. PAMC28654]UDL87864.1 hypothetical protein LGH82_22205 [Mesorhizobium sp. PAMC28654]